ncbi:glycosyltransferase family protein [Marimonas sp. MJW-29]|uniref:Glycosyltransferase family protein n=1 Tax=Sulfitobacter sediminis TaxID=3234186 RepID=A0ABV3RUC1_9RHOB
MSPDSIRAISPKPGPPGAARIALYSHDTFGLGHLRRSRAIATALTEANDHASALILTGSPVAGRFAFPERVDHTRLPGVSKLEDGSYISKTLGLDIDEVTQMRAHMVQSTIDAYQPDLLIVDKEPTGFRGELIPTLKGLKSDKTRCVLGLRDVLDDRDALAAEWEHKGAYAATEKFYDEIWVYGPRSVYDPTQGLPLSAKVRARMHWTGYLRRTLPEPDAPPPAEPYVLVTPGGGGDGAAMVDLVLGAYEYDPGLMPNAQLVYGPFLSGDTRAEFEDRVARLNGRVTAVGFDAQIETLYAGAQGVVCMGGYNTFCEVLSFDKRALIMPRTKPRREQHIRAACAEELGLVTMLSELSTELTPAAMAEAIRNLPHQPLPSESGVQELMGGLRYVSRRVETLISDMRQQQAVK